MGVLLIYTGLDCAGVFQAKNSAGLGSFLPFASVSNVCIHFGAQLKRQQSHRGTTSDDKCGGMRKQAQSCKHGSCFWLWHVCWHPIGWKKLHGQVQSQKVENIPLMEMVVGEGVVNRSMQSNLPGSIDEIIFLFIFNFYFLICKKFKSKLANI